MKCELESCSKVGRYEDVEEFYILCEEHYEQVVKGTIYG
jgi:hypothetical protein